MNRKKRIRVAEFPVRDDATVKALNEFAQIPFRYKGLDLLCRCNFRDEIRKDKKGNDRTYTIIETKPFLGDGKRDVTKENDVIGLTPGMCSSFSVWPPVRTPAQDLLDVCQNEVLRPQFVFLGMNWSAQLSPAGHGDMNARQYLEQLPRWSNWHGASIAPPDNKIGKKDNTRLVEAFTDNPLRGGYMTDFVKGLVDSDSQSILRFLRKGTLDGCGANPFAIFLDILKNELAELDRAFGLDKNAGFQKYLIVFGPTIYNILQSFVEPGGSLGDLFPDRTVLRTGTFYAFPHGKTREQVIEGTRTFHFPDGEVRTAGEIETDAVQCACPCGQDGNSGTSGAKA